MSGQSIVSWSQDCYFLNLSYLTLNLHSFKTGKARLASFYLSPLFFFFCSCNLKMHILCQISYIVKLIYLILSFVFFFISLPLLPSLSQKLTQISNIVKKYNSFIGLHQSAHLWTPLPPILRQLICKLPLK